MMLLLLVPFVMLWPRSQPEECSGPNKHRPHRILAAAIVVYSIKHIHRIPAAYRPSNQESPLIRHTDILVDITPDVQIADRRPPGRHIPGK